MEEKKVRVAEIFHVLKNTLQDIAECDIKAATESLKDVVPMQLDSMLSSLEKGDLEAVKEDIDDLRGLNRIYVGSFEPIESLVRRLGKEMDELFRFLKEEEK